MKMIFRRMYGLVLIGLLTVNVYADDSLFDPAVNYEVGLSPMSVISTDLDGDHHSDLVVANFGDNNISILMNNGDGTFAAHVTKTVGIQPVSVCAADFDGDNTNDLAVANFGSNNVSILLNNGNGTLSVTEFSSNGTNPRSVCSADLDQDGDYDIAVANHTSDNVSVLWNDGFGAFGVSSYYEVGNGPYSVISLDIDNDDDNDLVSVNEQGSTTISILENLGDGTFLVNTNSFAVGLGAFSVFSAHLDENGHLDLVVSIHNEDNILVLLNNGDGTFSDSTYATGDGPHSVFSADFDADGDYDIAVANEYSNDVSILLNDGDGMFPEVFTCPVGYSPRSVFSADFNGDSSYDLAVANFDSDSVSVLLNKTGPSPTGFADVVLDNVTNSEFLGSDSLIVPGVENVFQLRLTNDSTGHHYNVANGFRIYSPDGAQWSYPNVDTARVDATFESLFDSFFLNLFSVTGIGSDTIGFAGVATSASDGMPDPWDAVVYEIIIESRIADSGKHICLDSSFYPPGGFWVWGSLTDASERIPDWSGERCFEIKACPTWYQDDDGDTYGNPTVSLTQCEHPTGYVLDNTDCDDTNPDINPTTIWYQDDDGDTYGNPAVSLTQCEQPSGYVLDPCDCDDTNPHFNPSTVWYQDADGDTYGNPDSTKTQCEQPTNYVLDSTDCDDTDPAINPTTIWYQDADSDTYGNPAVSLTQCPQPTGYVLDNTDCDDTNPDINPTTVWYKDADGDDYGNPDSTKTQCMQPTGYVLDSCDCDDTNPAINPSTIWYQDSDSDTYGNPAVSQTQCLQPSGYVLDSTDCDDTKSWQNPNTVWYQDRDGDGFGNPDSSKTQCAIPDGYMLRDSLIDCNDSDSTVHPGAEEITCDGIDQDCDGEDLCSCCVGLTGNIDCDPEDMVDLSDLTRLIDYLFISFDSLCCKEEANMSYDPLNPVCQIDLGDLTRLIDYLFISFTPLPPCCGCCDEGTPTSSAPKKVPQIEVVYSYSDGMTTVAVESGMDLRGIQLELVGTSSVGPTSLLEYRLDMFFGWKNGSLIVGLVDVDGGEMITAGEHQLIHLEGQYEVISAVVSDINHNTLAAAIEAFKPVSLPTAFALHQNYPNPFNPTTEIGFTLPDAYHVTLDIYNVLGQEVASLIDRQMEAGKHTATWDGREAASGVYFYRFEAGDFIDTEKMILLK